MCTTPFIVPVTTFVVVETVVSTTVTAVEQLWVKTANKNNIDKFLRKVFILILNLRYRLFKILSLLTSFSRNLLLFEKTF
jgi:hypothetical protein